MLKILCLSHDKRWNINIMNLIENYSKNICVIFESHEDKEQFIHEVEEVNKLRDDEMLKDTKIPLNFESLIIPTDHSLLHRRLRALNDAITLLPISENDRIMFMDEDDNCDISYKLLNISNDLTSNQIVQLYRLDYNDVHPENPIRNWTNIKNNEWTHYTLHSMDYKFSVMYSYNYNFTGKLFPVSVIRNWLSEEYNRLDNIGPLMEQEDLILSISLLNMYPNSIVGAMDNSIYKYNYVSKNRQDPSKNSTIMKFLDNNIMDHYWNLKPHEKFPLKNKEIAIGEYHPGSMMYQCKGCCVLQRSYDYPWEANDINKTRYAYSVVYNGRQFSKEDLYRIMISKAEKYNLKIRLMERFV